MGPGQVLVCNQYSLLSAGTERARLEVGKETLLGKARRRPDQVSKVLQSVRQTGPIETWRMVADRLHTPGFMGYSSAGVAIEVGRDVSDIKPGSSVACAGGGYANHAEIVVVPRNLCVPVPDGVNMRHAAFATLGAIALQGVHQAGAEPGSRVAVIGLGLVGQLVLRLLGAYGYSSVGIDSDQAMVDLALSAGLPAFIRSDPDLARTVDDHWGGGADAIIIAAATKSTDPVELAGVLARDRATVVVLGDVTVAPPRPSYYHKELTIVYSRSYGPGRYDTRYEEGGIGYPEGYVAWDERRNLAEILRLIAGGRLDVDGLEPVVYPVGEAAKAFAELTVESTTRRVAVLLSYDNEGAFESSPARPSRATVGAATAGRSGGRAATGSTVRFASLGAGSFPTRMLLPHLKRNPAVDFSWIATQTGLSAAHQQKRWGFDRAVSTAEEGLAVDDTDAVLIMSRHDSHARYAREMLDRQVGLFCEKPLALSESELEDVASAWVRTGLPAMVGFNRRFAPSVRRLKDAVAGRGPLQVVYRVFAGRLPPDHWYFEKDQGGRILGEFCHFVDLANWLIGTPPRSVSASGIDVSDPVTAQSVSAQICYQDGSAASVVYGGATPAGAPKELVEVAGDGVAGRIEDFASLQLWGGDARRVTYRRAPKGHEEEMAAFVDLVQGRAAPEADFSLSILSTLVTCRVADSLASGAVTDTCPTTPSLVQLLGR
jgi:predicted dehydrogenase/threonine dehydrogenase-like Zn-dependent dehydrogenase